METNFKKNPGVGKKFENQRTDVEKKGKYRVIMESSLLILTLLKCHVCLAFTRNRNFYSW